MELKELKQILLIGGATLQKNGNIKTYKRGYQVSKIDLHIIPIITGKKENTKDITNIINNELKQLKNTENLGLWVDSNKIYIDKSIHINNKNKAIKTGIINNQISIYSWYKNDCIFLK